MIKEIFISSATLPFLISNVLLLGTIISLFGFKKPSFLKRRRLRKQMDDFGLALLMLLLLVVVLGLMIVLAFVLPIGWAIAVGLVIAGVIAYFFVS